MKKPTIPKVGDTFRGVKIIEIFTEYSGNYFQNREGQVQLDHDICEVHNKVIIVLWVGAIIYTVVGGNCDDCFGETNMTCYDEKYDSNDPWYGWLKFPNDDLPQNYPL
jgi:hypothetical protein